MLGVLGLPVPAPAADEPGKAAAAVGRIPALRGITLSPLEVVPGSHRSGVLAASALREISLDRYRPCFASRGDVLAMRPLLLHRSGRRTVDGGHNRVLHVVYATEPPEAPLRWRDTE